MTKKADIWRSNYDKALEDIERLKKEVLLSDSDAKFWRHQHYLMADKLLRLQDDK